MPEGSRGLSRHLRGGASVCADWAGDEFSKIVSLQARPLNPFGNGRYLRLRQARVIGEIPEAFHRAPGRHSAIQNLVLMALAHGRAFS
jgi:hypothetical protein